MRTYIIRGLLPWLVFFAFADGSYIGLLFASVGGFICLLFLNFFALRKRFLFGWASLVFFIVMFVLCYVWSKLIFINYSLIIATIFLALLCFFTVLIQRPFSLDYARLQVSETYKKHPVFLRVNYWISIFWGLVFLFYAVILIIFQYGIGNKLWMMQILPVVGMIIGILFMVLFPDYYRTKFVKKGTVAAIPGISEVKEVAFASVQIGYRELGEGPLLILAHGAQTNMHSWDPDFLRQLSKKFKVIIFDYPGIGFSRYKDMPFTADTIVECLHGFIDKLQLKPRALIGYSMGGLIVQKYVLKYQNEVDALILIATTCGGDSAVWCDDEVVKKIQKCYSKEISGEEQFHNMISVMFPEAVISRVFSKIKDIFIGAVLEGSITKKMLDREMQLILDWKEDNNLCKELPKIKLPTLIFAGQQDVMTPYANAELLNEKINNTKLIIYEDAGHGIVYQYPLDMADNIEEFLQSL